MTDDREVFALCEVATAQARRAFAALAADLFALLPCAAIEHVGATAVLGCISKGDSLATTNSSCAVMAAA